ncbi:MAG: YkgJ family cysteine cluster protein [Acidobacteriota bacterium]|nr:MAG: YkgJ family cysteine cluster protein [Acidobacteriota bacterium]
MNDDNEWVEGRVSLQIDGEPLNFVMTVPAKRVTIRRMLPVFQQMAGSVVGLSVDTVKAAGMSVSCKAGCGACCRQAVPLSEPEAFEIAELVERLPEHRKKVVKERFEKAVKKLAEAGWIARLDNAVNADDRERELIVEDYFREGIPCPFLEDESCSIHPDRPIACREYLVTSPAEHCKSPFKGKVRGVPLVVKPSATLNKISRTGNMDGAAGFVPMILALVWAENVEEDATRKTGEHWMADFFSNLTNDTVPGFKQPGKETDG